MANSDLCSTLPNIPGTFNVSICQNREQSVLNFLQNTLPKSDHKQIPDELRKTFIFNKFKIKRKQKVYHQRSNRQRSKHLSLSNITSTQKLKYSEVYPLNQLFLNYIRDLLGITSFTSIPRNPENPHWENINQQLMKADFHGAHITVHKSKCVSLVGLTGIVIQDTKNTFKICGTDDCIRTIPKDLVIIRIHMDEGVTLDVYGKHLNMRPVERCVRKFRNIGIIRL